MNQSFGWLHYTRVQRRRWVGLAWICSFRSLWLVLSPRHKHPVFQMDKHSFVFSSDGRLHGSALLRYGWLWERLPDGSSWLVQNTNGFLWFPSIEKIYRIANFPVMSDVCGVAVASLFVVPDPLTIFECLTVARRRSSLR